MTDNENVEETKPVEEVTKEETLVNEEIENVETRLKEAGVLTSELIQEVKKLVAADMVSELKENNALAAKELELKREQDEIEHANYVALKMESSDPWVEIVGDITSEEQGHRIELNWNNSFISFLKQHNIVADTEERAVQKYVTLLLKDLVDKDEDRFNSDYE